MNMKFIFGGIAFLILLLLVAGCTQPAAQQATPAPTTEPTTEVPATTAATAVPDYFCTCHARPHRHTAKQRAVSVQVQSNGQAINPQVIYTFNGGMGMNLIPEIDIMLTRSDGTVEIGNFTQPMSIGQTVSLAGHNR